MTLYHFSEDPTIDRFVPRTPTHRPDVAPLVWAIDEWHAPMYLFPRDCPRILLWQLPTTTKEDAERWFGASEARMIAHLEYAWLERMHSVPIYRYTLPPDTFVSLDDAGMHVSRETIAPMSIQPVGDLVAALRAASVELRLMERLTPLRGVWDTSLHASGIRLRNAQGWEYEPTPAPEQIRR
jgi:hypothetical protein